MTGLLRCREASIPSCPSVTHFPHWVFTPSLVDLQMRTLSLSIENTLQHLSCLHATCGLDLLKTPIGADPPTLLWVLGLSLQAASFPQLSWLTPWCCVCFVPCRDPSLVLPEHVHMSFSLSKTHKGLEMPCNPHVPLLPLLLFKGF